MESRFTVLLSVLLFVPPIASGQSFSSGSTGTDGALDLTSGDKTVQLPASGILNYTTVTIPAGRTLSFKNNLQNTPVVLLAQGAVGIAGTVSVAANGNTPGPGGFYGGAPGQSGFGPSPGQPVADPTAANGKWVGPLSLVPIIGGSGGGGYESCGAAGFTTGTAGGGAIVIASSNSILVSTTARIDAGVNTGFYCDKYGGWIGTGAAGAIRLVANSINVAGCDSVSCSYLNASVIRAEGPLGAVSYSGGGTPAVVSTINPVIFPLNQPIISIVSVGSYQVPSYSGSSFSTIDLLLPTQLPDPIAVKVNAANVPVGSPVTVAFSGSAGATSTTAALSGTNASSTATVYVSGLTRSAVTYLFVSTTFDPSLISANLDSSGPNAVSKIKLASAPGAKTSYRFLRRDGSEVSVATLPAETRRFFGF